MVSLMKVQTDQEEQHIDIGVLDNDYLRAFCVSYSEGDLDTLYDNICYGGGVILDLLVEENIPHNLFLTRSSTVCHNS